VDPALKVEMKSNPWAMRELTKQVGRGIMAMAARGGGILPPLGAAKVSSLTIFITN
jgi:hypothetical protein